MVPEVADTRCLPLEVDLAQLLPQCPSEHRLATMSSISMCQRWVWAISSCLCLRLSVMPSIRYWHCPCHLNPLPPPANPGHQQALSWPFPQCFWNPASTSVSMAKLRTLAIIVVFLWGCEHIAIVYLIRCHLFCSLEGKLQI